MTTTEPLVVVAGPTGDLGARVVRALADQGTRTKALVRRGAKRDTLPSGVEIVEIDYAQKHSLQTALRGATCVVSAVNGLDDVVIGLQSRLIDASVAAGVPRFIPLTSRLISRAPGRAETAISIFAAPSRLRLTRHRSQRHRY